jgi:hypothetical protein
VDVNRAAELEPLPGVGCSDLLGRWKLSFELFDISRLSKQLQSDASSGDGHNMCRIENEAQLGGGCDLKGYGDRIVVMLCPDEQLAIHDIARQIGEATTDERVLEHQSGVLSPSSAGIKSRSAFGLVKIGWQEMHGDRALPRDNLGNLGIVKLDYGVHVASGLTRIAVHL